MKELIKDLVTADGLTAKLLDENTIAIWMPRAYKWKLFSIHPLPEVDRRF